MGENNLKRTVLILSIESPSCPAVSFESFKRRGNCQIERVKYVELIKKVKSETD
jgi:hypothetical protein